LLGVPAASERHPRRAGQDRYRQPPGTLVTRPGP